MSITLCDYGNEHLDLNPFTMRTAQLTFRFRLFTTIDRVPLLCSGFACYHYNIVSSSEKKWKINFKVISWKTIDNGKDFEYSNDYLRHWTILITESNHALVEENRCQFVITQMVTRSDVLRPCVDQSLQTFETWLPVSPKLVNWA